MKRSNLIPITRIYDIYPKYTYSDDVKKFMDEIVDINRVNVYTKADIVAMLTEIKDEIFKQSWRLECICDDLDGSTVDLDDINRIIQQKIDKLKENKADA